MPTFRLNKLVRSRLPELCAELGQQADVKKLTGIKLQQAITDKITEEAAELKAGGTIDSGELADLLQLIDDAAFVTGLSRDDIELLRKEKEEKKGACIFVDENGRAAGYYISSIICDENDKWVEYYRKDPARFPEIPDGQND